MIKCYIKEEILQLLEQYLLLFELQWSSNFSLYDDQYHLDLFHYEKQIFHAFGLPLNPNHYLFLINLATSCHMNQYDKEWLYRKLASKAENSLSEIQRDDIATLSSAKAAKKNPFTILSDLNVPINSYTVFLYDEIVLKNRGDDRDLMNEFQLMKEDNLIADIYMLCFDDRYHANPIFHQLIFAGLKYLPCYLLWYHNKQKWR